MFRGSCLDWVGSGMRMMSVLGAAPSACVSKAVPGGRAAVTSLVSRMPNAMMGWNTEMLLLTGASFPVAGLMSKT